MTTQPDRQDGDGLPVAGTILQIGGASPGNGWGSNAIEVRESTGGVGWRWRTITPVENQRLLDALNTRATPQPSPEAAEGAGEPVIRDTNMFSRLANEPPAIIPEGYSAPLDIRTAAEIEHDRRALKSTPPKPAPDAIREAIKKIEAAFGEPNFKGHFYTDASGKSKWFDHKKVAKTIALALSAPVPSADGAMNAMNEALARQYNIPDELWKGASKENPMVPSGTGATEPLAICPSCGWKFHAEIVAAPPIRGDREAIAKIIHEQVLWKDRDRASLEQILLEAADAILSLPVPPGAKK